MLNINFLQMTVTAEFEQHEQAIEAWRNEYIACRNSTKGWEILERLARIQMEAGQEMETDDVPETVTFDDYSTSKLITLIMGDIDTKDLLVAHQ
uniref:Uncharacterized protein n=2 Tax=Caenorhabditis japonica TaxID=281687 RepID=A0A8R1IV84_CAEJA